MLAKNLYPGPTYDPLCRSVALDYLLHTRYPSLIFVSLDLIYNNYVHSRGTISRIHKCASWYDGGPIRSITSFKHILLLQIPLCTRLDDNDRVLASRTFQLSLADAKSGSKRTAVEHQTADPDTPGPNHHRRRNLKVREPYAGGMIQLEHPTHQSKPIHPL